MLFLADCPESGLIQWAKSIAISKTLGDLGSGSFQSDPVSSKIFRGKKGLVGVRILMNGQDRSMIWEHWQMDGWKWSTIQKHEWRRKRERAKERLRDRKRENVTAIKENIHSMRASLVLWNNPSPSLYRWQCCEPAVICSVFETATPLSLI